MNSYKEIAFQKDKEIQELNKEINSLYIYNSIGIIIIIALVATTTYALTGSIL
jgi:hypothetical protein